ncbi:39S ribosomal protein L49, mitochondrial isoform X4 [Chiroxiphia lanceolata]|uniref:39S ribosomal protein L49, mitochondrial isoform X4 n=1 Tax=Chiroxiphia lanceolata TaxID=296741 RepID=UPI0013CF1927|nr:39S ribosomal protein L49, mitochondrial isoform X4 [Chiroxiphia lanceolata]
MAAAAAMAALGRRLRGMLGGVRGLQTPPRAPHEESTAEFVFVERLLPPTRIPDPPPHPKYPTPSGWSPPAGPPRGVPYFVRRSRHHNLPVYLGTRKGGNRRVTTLRGASGDLWALERDLRAFLGDLRTFLGVPDLQVQVNEVTGTLQLKGHWGAELRAWLLQRGF